MSQPDRSIRSTTAQGLVFLALALAIFAGGCWFGAVTMARQMEPNWWFFGGLIAVMVVTAAPLGWRGIGLVIGGYDR